MFTIMPNGSLKLTIKNSLVIYEMLKIYKKQCVQIHWGVEKNAESKKT